MPGIGRVAPAPSSLAVHPQSTERASTMSTSTPTPTTTALDLPRVPPGLKDLQVVLDITMVSRIDELLRVGRAIRPLLPQRAAVRYSRVDVLAAMLRAYEAWPPGTALPPRVYLQLAAHIIPEEAAE